MEVLVISIGNEMLPFAWRLFKEGNNVTIVQQNHKGYGRCWEGKFHKLYFTPEMMKNGEHLTTICAAAVEKGATVVSKSYKWHGGLRHLPQIFSTIGQDMARVYPVMLGAWWDGKEYQAKHMLFTDVGLFDGGQGPEVAGGMTMVAPRAWPADLDYLLEQPVKRLKEEKFRGLVQVAYQFNPQTKQSEYIGFRAGWHELHSHCFLADQSLTSLLQGATPVLRKRFTSVVPVSVWPWPTIAADRPINSKHRVDQQVIAGMTPEQLARVYWHDIQVDEVKSTITTADSNGLIAVTYGSGNSMHLARGLAVSTAESIRLRGRQFRHDVGWQVDDVLADLELRGIDL